MASPSDTKPNSDLKALAKEISDINDLLKTYKARSQVQSRPVAQAPKAHLSWYGQNCQPRFPNTTQPFRKNSHHYYNRANYVYQKTANQIPAKRTVYQAASAGPVIAPKNSQNCLHDLSSSILNKAASQVSVPSKVGQNYLKALAPKNPLVAGSNGTKPSRTVISMKPPNFVSRSETHSSLKGSTSGSPYTSASGVDGFLKASRLVTSTVDSVLKTTSAVLADKIISSSCEHIKKPVSALNGTTLSRLSALKLGQANEINSSKLQNTSKNLQLSMSVDVLNVAKQKDPVSSVCSKPNSAGRVVASKYKVVNNNDHATNLNRVIERFLPHNNEAAKPIQSSLRTPNKLEKSRIRHSKSLLQPSSAKKLVKTAFKIVNKRQPSCSSGLKESDAACIAYVAKRDSSVIQSIASLNFKQNNVAQAKKNVQLKLVKPKLEVPKNKDHQDMQQTVPFYSGAATKKPSDCLEAKLMKVKGSSKFDLTDVSPEELIGLDDKALLKLSSMVDPSEKDAKSFVKRTKYKISKEQKKTPWSLALRKDSNASHFKAGSPHMLRKGSAGYLSGSKKRLSRSQRRKQNARYKKALNSKLYGKPVMKNCKSKGKSTIVTVHGTRFQMDHSGKSLKKLPDKEGKADSIESPVGNLAKKVLNRSIQTVVAASAKKSKLKYCMFYNRFGKCNRQANCPYIHDPSKIAVCTRFLRGTCKIDNCPFSHERNPGKMALCLFFLQGTCNVDDCPYRHEMLKPDAKLCRDFVKGYCAAGKECKNAHVLVCPQYILGKCTVEKCPYPHPPQKEKRKEVDESANKLEVDEKSENEKESERRYFSIESQLEVNPDMLFVNRQTCSSAGEEVPALPAYIPLSFDDADCLS